MANSSSVECCDRELLGPGREASGGRERNGVFATVSERAALPAAVVQLDGRAGRPHHLDGDAACSRTHYATEAHAIPLSAIALLIGATTPGLAQSPQGVWRPAEVVISSGPNAGRHTSDVQPGLLLITNRHYSTTFVQGFAPRPAFSDSPTDEERARIWGPFTANAGTYELKDSTFSFTPSVAKNPSVMAGTTNTARVRLRADSLSFIQTSNDGVETRSKWVRVERLQGR